MSAAPGMMLLVATAIGGAFVTSLATTLGLFGLEFWWELTALIVVVLLGHWLEMRAIGQARGALSALAELLPTGLKADRHTDRHIHTRGDMKSIVVGTDGSPNAEAAVQRAAEVARGTGARIHLVTAYPDVPSYREEITGSAKRQPIELRAVAETVLTRTAGNLRGGNIDVETHAREGDPAQVLVEVAQEQGADLIVVGSRGLTGIERFLLGSVSSKLSHHAPCSVMIVRAART